MDTISINKKVLCYMFLTPPALLINMLIRGGAMHSIIHDKSKKALITSLAGNIGVDQANAMLLDFKKAVGGIETKEHILIICPDNITASLFVLPILQNFIQMVGQLSFRKIYLINSDKYAAIIKQSLASYGIADRVRYSASIKDALNEK